MEDQIDFKCIAQTLTAKEIIMIMIDGLKDPYIIDFKSFDSFNGKDINFNQVAKNALWRLLKKHFKNISVENEYLYSAYLKVEHIFLCRFEFCINDLKNGFIQEYNDRAQSIGIAHINYKYIIKPLRDEYSENELQAYLNLADEQKVK